MESSSNRNDDNDNNNNEDSTIDLHSLSYVEPVNSNLICCICCTPFVDPVVVEPCDHTFCSTCISKALLRKASCPVDRSPLTSPPNPAAKLIQTMVNELYVYCPNADDGCDRKEQRQLVEHHLKVECEYVRIKCGNEECKEMVFKKEFKSHMENCRESVVKCENCNSDVKLSGVEAHRATCPAKSITCPHCSQSYTLAAHSDHLANCPDIDTPCLHSEFGCSWIGPRRELSSIHLPKCPFEPLKDILSTYKRRMDALEQENMQLKTELSISIEGIRNETERLWDGLREMFPELFIGLGAGKEGEDLVIPRERLVAENERLKNDIETLSRSLVDLELRQNLALASEVSTLQEEIQSLKLTCNSIRTQMHHVLSERRGDGSSSAGAPVASVARQSLSGNADVEGRGGQSRQKGDSKSWRRVTANMNGNRVGSGNVAGESTRQETKL